MDELTLQFLEGSKICWAGLVGMLYGLGGTGSKYTGKYLRRYVGSFLIMVGFVIYSQIAVWSWWYLLVFPLYLGAFSLGYGGVTSTKDKIRKRTVVALAIVTASLPVAIINQAWILLGVHLGITLVLWNFLGNLSIVNARAEESILGCFSCLLPLYYLS